MSEIKINLVKTSYGFSNLVFSDKPTEQMLAELKQNGWVYSKRQNRWYPGKTTGRNSAEIEKFAVEFKNKFNPETQNEVVKEPHVVSLSELSAEELREGVKYALNEVAQPLPKIDFTRENYNKLFPYSKIDTPIETVKIGAHQFEKLEEKDRKTLLQAVHDVLSNPDVIINEEKKSVFGDTENSHIYAKSYVINENTKAVQSVVVNIEDEYVSISTHKRDISNVVNKIKKPDQLLFAAAKVRLLAERLTNEKSVTVNPNRENEYVIPPQANITQPQEKSSEIPENHKTSFEQLTEKETKSVDEKINYVLEKLAKAGIEVVTDKEEFERILQREKILQKMTGKLSQEEQRRYFTFDEEDSKKFIEHIDKWQKDNTNPAKLIVVGKVTPVMKILGISERLIEVEQGTLDKMLRDEPLYPNDKQGHKLSVDDIYAIPSQLADPVMVFKSRTRDDSYVFFTERKDSKNHSILIPLVVDKRKGKLVIHEITSMYGKDNEINFVKTNIEENNLIYEDRERSCLWAKEKTVELEELNRKDAEKNKSPNGERFTQIQFLGQRFTDNGTYTFNILTKERLVNFLSSQNPKVQNFIQNDITYGFAHNGKIYLNPDVMNSNAAVHEYTHLWDAYTQKTNPELWQKGLSLFKDTQYWKEVTNDPNYQDIKDDENLVLSEIHGRICGNVAEKVLERIAELNGEQAKFDAIDWNKEAASYILESYKTFFPENEFIQQMKISDISKNMTEFLSMPIKDLFINERKLTVENEKKDITANYVQENRFDEIRELEKKEARKNIPQSQEKSSDKDIRQIREQCRKILEKPDSEITAEEKQILAQYEGGGGIKEENRSNAAVLNEFYTPKNVIDKVWKLVDAYSPNAKTVLEPSSGIGKFAAGRPNNKFTLRELDETSARIAKILHPEADVIQGAFQEQFFDENGIAVNKNYQLPKYDVVIGNPPYGEYLSEWKGKGEGQDFNRYEEYFISRGIDSLKDENSILAFVVPSGFLNTSADRQKEIIASKGKLIDAYRLPAGTFPTTKVGTDIIIMQNWDKDKAILKETGNEAYQKKQLDSLIEENLYLLSDNNFFINHPEKVLGEIKIRSNRFGKEEEFTSTHEGLTVQDELNKLDDFAEKINKASLQHSTENLNAKEGRNEVKKNEPVEFNETEHIKEKQEKPESTIPFIELAKSEMEKTPETVFEKEYAKEHNLKLGVSGLGSRDFKYRWDRKTVINSETKEVLFYAGKNILAKIDSNGIFKKLYSDENYKKLTTATKENLDMYLKGFENSAQNLPEQYLGTFEDKYYFKDISNSIGNLIIYNPVTKQQAEINAYNSYVCAAGIDIETNEELENKYDYYDAKHKNRIPLFYAKAQSLYPEDRKVKIENIISDNQEILESINEDIESIDFDEKTMSYSELDNAWNERQNLKINAMLKFSNLNHDEFFETAKAYYQNQKEKIKELRIDTSSKRIKAEDANLIFEEIIKNPLDGEKIFKAGASFVSYVKNNSGYDVLIDDKRALFIDESQKQLSTYNNYFVTKELLNAFKEKFNGEINISDIPYAEENISLNKIIAEKNSSVAKNKTGTEIAEFFISSISSNETEIKKQIGLEVKIVSAGIISDVFIDDMNHKAFEFNKQNNLLKIYQPCFDREMIPGIEKAFIEKFHDLSIDKDITIEDIRYNDHNGQTVILNAKPQRFIPEKEQLMTAQDFTELYGTNWDIEERRFWEVTCYNNYVDTSKLTSEEFEKLKSSQNYFESSAGKYIHKVLFASGNIYDKLDSNEDNYRKGLISEASYNKNKELLQNSVPVKYKINEISVPVNSPFIKSLKINDVPIREKFLQWATGYANDECQNRRNSISNYAEAGIKRDDIPANISWSDVVDYIDGIELDFIRDDDLSEKEKSQIRNQKLNSRKETAEKLFTRYVQTVLTEEEKEIFVDKYNRCFNNNVEPDYSKLPLFVNGMNYFKNGSEFKLFEQQIKGAAFLSNKGNGLLAYEVGVGKTATGIVATVNQIQTGRASRPLIVVPKSVIKAWEKDINELFPSIPLNVLDNMSMKAIGKYYDGNHGLNIPAGSITLVTKEALNNFAFTAETIRNDLFNDYADLLSLNEDLESDNARIRATAQERIFSEAGCSNFVKNGDYILWEKTGFDHITVDEAHAFKNLFKVPRPKKGEVNEFSAMGSGNPSKRALKMFNITQLIQKHNENRNVFMLTATPFTNSPLEVYSMLTYIARKELEKQGIKDLYSFCQQYASTEYELAITQKNTVEYRNVMKGFNDVTSLQNTLKQYIDKVSAEEALVIRPKKITHPVYLQPTELQNEIFDFAQNNLMNYQPKINEKRAPTLEGLNIMNLATLSPALVNEELLVDPKTHTSLGIVTPDISEVVECSPKLKAVCDTVVKNWKEHKDCGQVIYMNVGTEAFPYMIKYMENHGIPKEVFARIDGQEVVMGGKKVPGKTEARETVAQAFNDDKNPCKILIGSSAISEGMNLNGNSIALYNLTLGWNPTESVQVEGRIWRQGNQQGHVHIVYPLIENSCDPFLYQKHDEKMSRIDDLFSYKGTKMVIDGINPEDAKWALIKDPGRRADLEITEKLAVLNKEMLMYENQLSDYDSLIKSRKDFSERLESKKKQKEEYVNNYQQSLFSGNARRTEDEQQQGIERFNKSINDCEKQLSNITAKFLEMGIENSEDEITYSSKINEKKAEVQKKVDFLKSDENKTAVVEKYREQIQSELLEKNERLQKSPLHEAILNDLVPFSVVEYQVQRERYENALKNKDKNPKEFIKAEKRWNDFIKKRNNEEIEKPSAQKIETKDNDKKVLSETTPEKSEKPVAAEKIITATATSEPKKNKSVIQLSLFEELSLGNIQEKKRTKEEEKMKPKPKVYREEEKNKQLNIAPEADKQEQKMKKTSSQDISYENEEYWKTQFLNDNAETFKALDDFLNNGIKPKNDEFIFSKVPEILKSANVSENEIVIRTSIINKARNEHSLSADEIRKAIENIAAPVLIFDSDRKSTENKKNSYLSLTDTFAKNGKPVAFSMNLDSEYERKNRIIEVNEIRTIHERTLVSKNGVDLIQKWTAEGLCRYVDDKKISEWSKAAGVQFPLAVLQSDNNKILTKSELVNSQQVQKNQQRKVAFETSKEKNMTELKTYHTLKEEDVKNLEIISDEDFSDIVDSIILNDYKNIPNTIRLPNINSELAEKLGLEKDSAFIMKKSAAHIRPDRKGSYNQALDTEEYRMIPKVMRDATFALVDKRVKNFQILFDDKNDIKKINKIVFNKDELGNYLVTIGKVGRQNSISEKENIVVGVGVAPTISDLRFPKGQPATRLRPSPTTVNSNIAQNKEKSTIIQKNQPVLKYEDKIGKDNLEKIKKHFEKNIPDGAQKFKRLNISEARTVKEVVSEVKKTFGFDKLDKKYAAKLEKDFFDTCGIKVESKNDFIKRQNQNDRNQDAGKKDIEPDNDYPDYTDDCGMDY